MTWIPPWLPYDLGSLAIVAVGFALLGIGLFAWSAACLRVALRGDWLAAIALQTGAWAVVWSALCGRQILPMARRPWITTYTWLGVEWEHRDFMFFVLDGFVWVTVGAALVFASIGLAAIGSMRPADEEAP